MEGEGIGLDGRMYHIDSLGNGGWVTASGEADLAERRVRGRARRTGGPAATGDGRAAPSHSRSQHGGWSAAPAGVMYRCRG